MTPPAETTPPAATGEEPFELPRGEAPPSDELVVDLDGYEGPIDVLLSLAREQKVDLTKISILQLADQYLEFISAAHRMRLEIAATISSWRRGSPTQIPPAAARAAAGGRAKRRRHGGGPGLPAAALEAMQQAGSA